MQLNSPTGFSVGDIYKSGPLEILTGNFAIITAPIRVFACIYRPRKFFFPV